MQDLQIPIHRVSVEVLTDSGENFRGRLYTADSPYHHTNVEHLLYTLNDERSFLPFDAEETTSNCSILNKTHITRVTLDSGELLRLGDQDSTTCRLLLTDGTRVEGNVTIDTPRFESRLLDKLNRADRFMRVDTDSSIVFVQTSHVVRVD